MCIPYMITKKTGVKNIKEEILTIITSIDKEFIKTITTKNMSKEDISNMITPASYMLYNFTKTTLEKIAPQVIGGMQALAKCIQKNRIEEMAWKTPVKSNIKYKYHKLDERTYFYGPSVKMAFIVKEPIKKSIDYKQNYSSSIAHFIHSLDAS